MYMLSLERVKRGHKSSLMHYLNIKWPKNYYNNKWGASAIKSFGFCISIFQSIVTYLELGLDVLTGRALRGGGGGILTGASSEK